jgi:hypothetical protein
MEDIDIPYEWDSSDMAQASLRTTTPLHRTHLVLPLLIMSQEHPSELHGCSSALAQTLEPDVRKDPQSRTQVPDRPGEMSGKEQGTSCYRDMLRRGGMSRGNCCATPRRQGTAACVFADFERASNFGRHEDDLIRRAEHLAAVDLLSRLVAHLRSSKWPCLHC